MSELRDNPDNVEVVHEESDVNVGAIIRYGVGLVVVAAVVHVFLWWLLGVYETPERACADAGVSDGRRPGGPAAAAFRDFRKTRSRSCRSFARSRRRCSKATAGSTRKRASRAFPSKKR